MMSGRQFRMLTVVIGIAVGVMLFTVVQAQDAEPEVPATEQDSLALLVEVWPVLGLFGAVIAGLSLGKVVGRG